MSAQTSYAINQGIAYEGQLYALFPHDIVSRAVETVAGINFGVAVSRGTDKEKQIVVGGADYLGIALRSLEREGAANTGETSYSETETAAVLREGYVYAKCPAGCTPGAAVKFTDATGVLNAGAPAAGETAIAGATWETTTAAGAIGVIRLS